MDKTINQKIKLGLFVIIGTVVFLLALFFVGDKQNMFGNTSILKATFQNINGLQTGNNVRYAGLDIGSVKNIQMVNDSTINVEMIIENSVFKLIKKNAIATIGSDGLVGNMIINIIPGKGNAAIVETGDTIESFNKIRTEDMLNTLSITNENAAILTANLIKITKDITEGSGTIGLLLNDPETAKDMKETIKNLKLTSEGTTASIQQLNTLITSLNKKNNVIGVLNDTIIANKIKKIVTNLEKSSSKIDVVVENLNSTILNAKDGKGAINYLSNNPKLVEKIDSTMTNINESSVKLNQNLEALKSNFFFKGYFKKQEKMKLKNKKQN
jgi:phospholipid/cholesterol/gamma-HCH transport system substrate-binding protein